MTNSIYLDMLRHVLIKEQLKFVICGVLENSEPELLIKIFSFPFCASFIMEPFNIRIIHVEQTFCLHFFNAESLYICIAVSHL